MKDLLKFFSIFLGAAIILIGGALLILNHLFGGDDEYYSKKDLIKNYEGKSHEIDEVKRYVNSILPAGKNVDIEFGEGNNLEIFHVITDGSYNSNWHVDLGSAKADSLLKEISWTRGNVEQLKRKLVNANCISVTGGEPTTIGFKRSGMGMYFYKIFNKPLDDSTKINYNDGCTYSFYKGNVVLEYGGGAIGPQCFEDLKRSSN